MLVKLNASALVLDDGVTRTGMEPIPLNSDGMVPGVGDEAKVIGHGLSDYYAYTLEEELMEVSVYVYDNDVCAQMYNNSDDSYSTLTVVPESMVGTAASIFVRWL